MSGAAWAQLLVLGVLLAISTPLLGIYMAKVYGGEQGARRPRLPPGRARSSTASAASTPKSEQRWQTYAISLLAFSFVSRAGPLRAAAAAGSPAAEPGPPEGRRADLSFNTAVSFLTNTNWQNYSGESTMSHLTQMAGPRAAQLRVGRRRRGRRGRADPRPRPPAHPHARQLLGRPHPHHRFASCSRWRSSSRSCS